MKKDYARIGELDPKFDVSELNEDFVQKVELALGRNLEDISVVDTTKFTIEFNRRCFQDNLNAICQRVSRKFLPAEKGKLRIGDAKGLLLLVKNGDSLQEAIDQFTNKIKGIPIDLITSEVVRKIEDSLGKKIDDILVIDNTNFDIEIGNTKYSDNPVNLFTRISRLIGDYKKRNLGRDYLINIRDKSNVKFLKSPKAAKTIEVKPTNIPVEYLSTTQFVLSFEESLGIPIEEISTQNKKEFSIEIDGVRYNDSICNLLCRIAFKFFGSPTKRLFARNYLCLIKNGFNSKDAIAGAANYEQWASDKNSDVQSERISDLKLDDAIALLGHDPSKLKLYIRVIHSEISEDEIDRLVMYSFKGLTIKKSYDLSDFDETLEPCTVTSDIPNETDEPTVTIEGRAPGADSVMILGRWNRRIRVNQDGNFKARLALDIGAQNSIHIQSLNHDRKASSETIHFSINQTSEQDDIESLVMLIDGMGKKALADIQQNPGRLLYLIRSTELVLIKKFVKSFEDGRNYINELIENSKSAAVKKILKTVLQNFRKIDRTTYPNVKKESPLYFFQKYCVAGIQSRMQDGDPGVILANAPGLGKTRTALVAVNGDRAAIIAPNSVVSGWGEEAERCLNHANVLTLQNIPQKERIRLLQASDASHIVTNIEFLRAEEEDPRYELLSDDDTIIVHDEAHSLANLQSEQSKGARRLKGKFSLNLTATPFKNPKMMRRMLYHLYPDDIRFSSDKAFAQAFPSGDPAALRTLSVLKDKHVIRFRKEDVLEEMDPNIPVEEQIHRLPKKEYIQPEIYGKFTMSNEQANAIFEMFLDWPKWCKKYDKYVPKDEIAKMDHLRGNQFALAKQHALRQIVNNPEYIGLREGRDAKTEEMLRAIETCIAEGRKVVVFCQYNAQAMKYAELLQKYKPCLYTGFTSDEGLKSDESGKVLRFKRHEEGGWEFDNNGYPIDDPKGMPMLAMDYERLTYQNAEDRKVIISTYSAGAVGVTFTAGKAMIEDDLPRDCIEEIQAEDRTHRIDHEHQTHHSVKYIKMISTYSPEFLEMTRHVWVQKNEDGTYTKTTNTKYAAKNDLKTAYEEFFQQGTFDEVKMKNLQVQRKMFHLINDGIADESVLQEGQIQFSMLRNEE